MGTPTVAIVLHYRNERSSLSCLGSLADDGIRRVVIVDNSADDSASMARMEAPLSALRELGLTLDVIEPHLNMGFAAGVNVAVRHVRRHVGEANILLINNDAVLAKGSSAALSEAIAEGADVAQAQLCDRSGRHYGSSEHYYQRWLALYLQVPCLGSFRYPTGCCLMIGPRALYADLLDERFFFYGEDVALGWRLKKENLTLRTVTAARVHHEGSASSRRGSLFYEYHMNRAHLLLIDCLADSIFQRFLMLLGRVLILPLRASVRTVRFRSMQPWRALVLAILDVTRGNMRMRIPDAGPSVR